jgi:hypothetical protein
MAPLVDQKRIIAALKMRPMLERITASGCPAARPATSTARH